MYAAHDDTRTDFVVVVVGVDGSGCGYGVPAVATAAVVDTDGGDGDVAAPDGEAEVGGGVDLAQLAYCV